MKKCLKTASSADPQHEELSVDYAYYNMLDRRKLTVPLLYILLLYVIYNIKVYIVCILYYDMEKTKYEHEFKSPYANSVAATGNIGLASELEDDFEEDMGQARETRARENRKYFRIARSEEYGLGFVEG
jgi:hypothetical protein